MVPRPFSLQPLKFPAQAVASSQDDPGSFPVRLFLSLYFYASSRVSFKTLPSYRHSTTKYPFFGCLTVQFGPKEVYHKHRMRFKKVPVSNSQPGWKKFCQEKRSGGKNSVWEFFLCQYWRASADAKVWQSLNRWQKIKSPKKFGQSWPQQKFLQAVESAVSRKS